MPRFLRRLRALPRLRRIQEARFAEEQRDRDDLFARIERAFWEHEGKCFLAPFP